MTKRRVMTYTWEKVGDEYVQVEAGEGIFAQYGTDFEEHSGDLCSVSSAIVEMPDGRVRNMPLHMIRFLVEKSRDSVTYTRRAVYEVDYASEDMLCVDRFRIFSTLLLPENGESKKENINAYMLAFRSVRGEDKIKELEEKAVRLAKKFKGSYAFSFFDRDGNRMLHSRRLYPLEER